MSWPASSVWKVCCPTCPSHVSSDFSPQKRISRRATFHVPDPDRDRLQEPRSTPLRGRSYGGLLRSRRSHEFQALPSPPRARESRLRVSAGAPFRGRGPGGGSFERRPCARHLSKGGSGSHHDGRDDGGETDDRQPTRFVGGSETRARMAESMGAGMSARSLQDRKREAVSSRA